MNTIAPQENNILIYTNNDGSIQVETLIKDETVWLNQEQMATLFGKGRSTITEHIQNVFKEGELDEKSVCRESRLTAKDDKKYLVKHYNLDVIISVGYRVKSLQGTQFRKRATQRIHEYIVKGFTMDDLRLSQGGHKARYFEELLQRIRDIRSSERNFYQKVTDIYTTSIDYKKDEEITKQFFATIQNKMHYAIHGHTAAELIHERADADKMLMGLTSFKGGYVTQKDTTIAKNYLAEDEIKQLNLIVSMYLDFAELQATNGRLMKMQDWIEKLDEFLKASERQILDNAGSISHEEATKKAKEEFEKYKQQNMLDYTSDYDTFLNTVKKLPKK
ncbi:MAG: cell filamentation protein Fic [candidate division SR1 bacterium CG_4_9_14_3_um_filter_40_9]|nr:MAG: cell filamentation protein Fic [candidate division SR1 bacterium CG_4_9_14_3_um_filter_40_9]